MSHAGLSPHEVVATVINVTQQGSGLLSSCWSSYSPLYSGAPGAPCIQVPQASHIHEQDGHATCRFPARDNRRYHMRNTGGQWPLELPSAQWTPPTPLPHIPHSHERDGHETCRAVPPEDGSRRHQRNTVVQRPLKQLRAISTAAHRRHETLVIDQSSTNREQPTHMYAQGMVRTVCMRSGRGKVALSSSEQCLPQLTDKTRL